MAAPLLGALLLLGLLSTLPAEAGAQQRPQAQPADTASAVMPMEEMEQQAQMQVMEQQMRAMLPMMTATLRNVTQSTMAALAEPETARNLAKFMRNYYQALIAEGFTRPEALQILGSVGLPSFPSM